MEERADMLRRRIVLYRRYLREGVDALLAGEYVRQLAEDEAEVTSNRSGRATIVTEHRSRDGIL
jgi:hypothetical protein